MVDILAAGIGGLIVYLIVNVFIKFKEKKVNAKFKDEIVILNKRFNVIRLRKEKIINDIEFIDKMRLIDKEVISIAVKETDEYRELNKAKLNGLLNDEEYKEKLNKIHTKIGLKNCYPFTELDINYIEIFELLWKDISSIEDVYFVCCLIINKELGNQFYNMSKEQYKDFSIYNIFQLYQNRKFKNHILNENLKLIFKTE